MIQVIQNYRIVQNHPIMLLEDSIQVPFKQIIKIENKVIVAAYLSNFCRYFSNRNRYKNKEKIFKVCIHFFILLLYLRCTELKKQENNEIRRNCVDFLLSIFRTKWFVWNFKSCGLICLCKKKTSISNGSLYFAAGTWWQLRKRARQTAVLEILHISPQTYKKFFSCSKLLTVVF